MIWIIQASKVKWKKSEMHVMDNKMTMKNPYLFLRNPVSGQPIKYIILFRI